MKPQKLWADGLQMFGVDVGVDPDRVDDFMFQAQTSKVVEIANKMVRILIGATMADNKEDIANITNAFEVLKEDFERGAREGVFNPTDVKAMVEVVNDFVANPLKLLEDGELN